MREFCILIDHNYFKDSRAQRTASALAEYGLVKVFSIMSANELESSNHVNIEIIAVNLKKSMFDKILRHSAYFILNQKTLQNAALKVGIKFTAIYAHDIQTLKAGVFLKKHFGCKLIYDIHDLAYETVNQNFPENTSSYKKIIFQLFIRVMKLSTFQFEKKFILKTDYCFTVNESCKEYVLDLYPKSNCKSIANYPRLRDYVKKDILRKELKLNNEAQIVIYHGGLNRGRYLSNIIDCAAYLKDNQFLVVLGEGTLEKRLKEKVNLNGLITDKVFFLPFKPYEELFHWISSANLGICLIEPLNQSKWLSSANKITECYAAKIPVIVNNAPECMRLIKNGEIGFLADNSSIETLGQQISEVLNFNIELERKGSLSRNAFEKEFNWESQLDIFNSHIKQYILNE
jgi:glycosyltransferase involved in cell wall biosynthesis